MSRLYRRLLKTYLFDHKQVHYIPFTTTRGSLSILRFYRFEKVSQSKLLFEDRRVKLSYREQIIQPLKKTSK